MVRSGVHSAISNMVSRLELFAAAVKWISTGKMEIIREGNRAKWQKGLCDTKKT